MMRPYQLLVNDVILLVWDATQKYNIYLYINETINYKLNMYGDFYGNIIYLYGNIYGDLPWAKLK